MSTDAKESDDSKHGAKDDEFEKIRSIGNDKEHKNGKDDGLDDDDDDDDNDSDVKAPMDHRGSLDFSNRKVLIQNVLKYVAKRDIKKMSQDWIQGMETTQKIEFTRVKKPPKDNWIVVTLKEESMVQPFVQYFNKCVFKNKRGGTLQAITATEKGKQALDRINNNTRKRKSDDHGINSNDNKNDSGEQQQQQDMNDNDKFQTKRQKFLHQQRAQQFPQIITEEQMKDAAIPLWRKSYEVQLKIKVKEMVKKSAMKIVSQLKEKFRQIDRESKRNKNRKRVELYKWINQMRPIIVEDILPASTMTRNKCEFTFGYRLEYEDEKHNSNNNNDVVTNNGNDNCKKEQEDKETQDTTTNDATASEQKNDDSMNDNNNTKYQKKLKKIPSVGMLASGWTGGVAKPHCCPNIPSEACAIMDIFEQFLANSPMPPYDCMTHTGFWRTLTLRTSRRTGECMLIIMHAPPSGGAGVKKTTTKDRDDDEKNDSNNNNDDNNNTHDYTSVFQSEKDRLLSMLIGKKLPVIDNDRNCKGLLLINNGDNNINTHATPPNYTTNIAADTAATTTSDRNAVVKAEDKTEDTNGNAEGNTTMTDAAVADANVDAKDTKDDAKNKNNDATTKFSDSNEDHNDYPPMYVTSVFFQEFAGLSNPTPEHPVQHSYGEKALKEKLGKCTFQISPGAFFQVNTDGAETLYNVVVGKIRELKSEPEKTLLFDVCCGTGTIGLTCMKEGVVQNVVGVDISTPAIEDAKINARLNGFGGEYGYADIDDGNNDHNDKIKDKKNEDNSMKVDYPDDVNDDGEKKTRDEIVGKNPRFIAARAEHVLGRELKKLRDHNLLSSHTIVAVVDPARDGLHPDVMKALRKNEYIQRIVYVSCNPTGSLVRDSTYLCQPSTKKFPGRPFRPSSAQPVDMFPFTNHCELVMTFDRLSQAEADGK